MEDFCLYRQSIIRRCRIFTNKKATTHFDYYEALQAYCKEVVPDRVVEDGNIITAGAVSSSIDLGLFLCTKWAGAEAAKEIRRRMDYRG